ncbi:PH domain-containing protein [Streptomyces sp. NBC_01218]|uniref:PH domain-containing protein n=1 Tax=unclassified Streptomyces TaxID=2593676 RepID=UPI0023B98888|nr:MULTISPECIES: PH domain-containing protein [unclassified Streptomyces]WEH42870.1 PH domain-containing protein [Streptomyces sp. AM 2-1-1]WSQ54509.1 PH domain-containing protein [Streptomyces sp. NBC_01218]
MSASAPRTETPALPVTFRPGLTRLVLLAIALALFAVITVVALMLESLGPGDRVTFVVFAALFSGVLVLLARPRITADEEGVTVVNLTRTHRLAWEQILQVNLRVGDPWLFLGLSDGTSLPALGIQPGLSKRRAVQDAEALRGLVASRGTAVEAG